MKASQAHRRVRRAVLGVMESLEPRQLLSVSAINQIPSQQLAVGEAAQTIELSSFFNDPTITGTAVDLEATVNGTVSSIPVVLTDSKTPQTVTNFLHYISSGEYADTIFHRAVPGFILQGGGYTADGTAVTSFGTIPGEHHTSNTTGTIAMALSNGPNTATSQWFINLANNDGSGSTSDLDDTSHGGPFTAFGNVIYNGMNVINAITNFGEIDASAQVPAWTNLPVTTAYTGPSALPPVTIPTADVDPVPAADMVTLNPVIVPDGLNFTVTSSNTNVATASISTGGDLLLSPVNSGGKAAVTVTATDLDGNSVSETFNVVVTDSSSVVTIGGGGQTSMTYTDADGSLGTVAFRGDGSASVQFSGQNVSQRNVGTGIDVSGTGLAIVDITTTGTDGTSVLTITAQHDTKQIDVGGLTTQSLSSVMARGVNLTGDVTASGAINSMTLNSVSGGSINAQYVGTFTTTGDFADDLTLTDGGIDMNTFKSASVSTGTWNISGVVKTINVTRGSLGASITAGAINTLTVKGSVSNAALNFTAAGPDLKTLSVSGAITGTEINAAGNLGALSAADLVNSEIYAGVGALSAGQVLPGAEAEFAAISTIASLKLKNAPVGGYSFSNSDIAAAKIGTLALATVQTNNGGNPTGVAAEHITQITAIANVKFNLKNLKNTTSLSTILTADGINLGDFEIALP